MGSIGADVVLLNSLSNDSPFDKALEVQYNIALKAKKKVLPLMNLIALFRCSFDLTYICELISVQPHMITIFGS